jgi:hypothetical protein
VEEIHLEDNSILTSFEEIKFVALAHFSDLYMEKGPVDREIKGTITLFHPHISNRK